MKGWSKHKLPVFLPLKGLCFYLDQWSFWKVRLISDVQLRVAENEHQSQNFLEEQCVEQFLGFGSIGGIDKSCWLVKKYFGFEAANFLKSCFVMDIQEHCLIGWGMQVEWCEVQSTQLKVVTVLCLCPCLNYCLCCWWRSLHYLIGQKSQLRKDSNKEDVFQLHYHKCWLTLQCWWE